MDLTSNNTHTLDSDTKAPPPTQPTNTNTPKSISFTNGTHKRHHQHRPTTTATPPPPSMVVIYYKECLKNHAASIGGHALDGCGEFMPSSSTNPTDPRSLKCAACGCHRNFHRRDPPEPSAAATTNNNHHHHHNPTFLNCFYSPSATTAPPPPPPQPLPHRAVSQSTSPSLSSSPSHSPSPMSSPSSPPPLSHVPPSYHSSAPHMLLALGTAYSAAALPSDHEHHQHHRNSFNNNNNNYSSVVLKRENPSSGKNKRYRTKFSQEQKEKMHSFSEKLGWRMHKGDDGLVQEFCNDIGVPRAVFKVWMHNNKNAFKKRSSEAGNAPNQNEKINNNGDDDDDDDDDDGNDGNNRGGGVGGGVFDSDINNPYNSTNGRNNDIHRNEDSCVNVHVPINGLSS